VRTDRLAPHDRDPAHSPHHPREQVTVSLNTVAETPTRP